MMAYTCVGSDRDVPNAMRPYGPSGKPSCRRVHVSPPSVDRHRPLPFPPLSSFHGKRRTCHMPAKRTLGLPGSITRSPVPVVSFTNSTFFHVWPPSVVRNTPRSALGFHALRSEEHTSELQSQ